MNSTFWPNCACPPNNSKSTMKCDPDLIPGERRTFLSPAWNKYKFRNPAGSERTTFPKPVSQSNYCIWYSNVKVLVIERSCSHFRTRKETKESFRFKDEDDYEYKIFPILSSALREPRHFGGKRDSRRHSTTSFSENVVVAGTSYQILEV